MLHTKLRDNRTDRSDQEGFLKFLPYLGMVAILVM